MSLADAFNRGAKEAKQKADEERKATFFGQMEKSVEDDLKIIEPMDQMSTVRASGAPYFCAREEVIRSYIGMPWANQRRWIERWRMARGTGMHHAFQNELWPLRGCLDGQWVCDNCGHVEGSLIEDQLPVERPTQCPKCHFSEWTYKEYFLEDHELMVTGHCDGLWLAKKSMWEIKTCGRNTYQSVIRNGPLSAHKAQAALYLPMLNELLEAAGLEPLTHVRFYYVPMEDVDGIHIPPPSERSTPYEVDFVTGQIVYPYHHDWLKPYRKEVRNEIMTFRHWMKSNEKANLELLPKRHMACTTEKNAGRWKWGCDLCDECFAMDDEYKDEKVKWLTADGTIDGRIAPKSVMLGGGEISIVGAQVIDPHGLIGDPETTYRVTDGPLSPFEEDK